MSTFGKRLKQLRSNKKMNQDELASIMSISKSSIGMYERNEREPSFDLVKRFAEYFDVSIDYLINGNEKIMDDKNLFFFDMEGLSDEEIEDIKNHIEYVKWKAKKDRGE